MNALPEPFHGKRSAILRPPAFQAGCRGFESRLPLQHMNRLFTGSLQAASWQASGDRESKEAVLLLMRGRTMKAYLSGVVKACCSSWGAWMIQPQLKMQHEMRQWL